MFQVNEENHREEALESVGRGTCDHCGEELPMNNLIWVAKNEWMCAECKTAHQETDPAVCETYGFEPLGIYKK